MSCFHKSRTWNDVRWATPFLRLQFVREHFGQMSPARRCDCGAEDGRCSRPYASKREKRTSQGFSCTCHAMMAARHSGASCRTSHRHGIASPNDAHAANAVGYRACASVAATSRVATPSPGTPHLHSDRSNSSLRCGYADATVARSEVCNEATVHNGARKRRRRHHWRRTRCVTGGPDR